MVHSLYRKRVNKGTGGQGINREYRILRSIPLPIRKLTEIYVRDEFYKLQHNNNNVHKNNGDGLQHFLGVTHGTV